MRIGSVLLALAMAGAVGAWLAIGAERQGGGAETSAPSAANPTSANPTSANPTSATPTSANQSPPPMRVLVRQIKAQPLSDQLVLRGRTEAARNVEVKAQTGGLVVTEPLRKGAAVRRGDLLCAVEAGEREAMLAEARARLSKAESDAEASRALSARGFSSSKTVAADAAELEAARAMVRRMSLDLERVRITAPFDGVLESDAAEIGAFLRPGDVCAVVIALDPIKTVVFAPERDIQQIAPGTPGTVRLISGATFDATVSFVSRAADPETRTFRVEATAPNASGAVRDGMTAEITLPLDVGAAHLIPASALTLGQDGSLGVRLAESAPEAGAERGVARFARVTVLRDGLEGVWVRGLPETAPVIVVGQEFVRDGGALRIAHDAAAAAAAAP